MLAVLSSSSSANSSSSVAQSSSDAYKYDYIEDSRDGKKYKVLKFGKRRWMVENLAFDYQYPGVETRNAKEPDSVEFYGRTYLWSEAMDSSAIFSTTGKNCGYGKPKCRPCGARGICPSGWHVPSLAEWFELLENDDEDKLNLFAVYRKDYKYLWVSNEYDNYEAYLIKPKGGQKYELIFNRKSISTYVRCVEDDDQDNDAMCKIAWPKDDVNKVLDLLEGDLLRTNETYWSSSQSPEWNETNKVMTIKMSNGDCSIATDKTTELYVRMIKEYDNCLYSH